MKTMISICCEDLCHEHNTDEYKHKYLKQHNVLVCGLFNGSVEWYDA